jgi:hypothetical protein
MGNVDQVYVPALVLTNSGKVEPSRKAVLRLQQRWTELRDTFSFVLPDKVEPLLDSVTGVIDDAYELVDQGQLDAGHEELEKVRWITMELRDTLGVEYYLDRLTRYHEILEGIVTAGKDSVVDSTAVETIDSLYPVAQQQWGIVREASPDTAVFDLSSEELATVQEGIRAESDALDSLGLALESGEPGPIAGRARALRPPFVSIFTAFGDFEAAGR